MKKWIEILKIRPLSDIEVVELEQDLKDSMSTFAKDHGLNTFINLKSSIIDNIDLFSDSNIFISAICQSINIKSDGIQ